MLVRPSDYIFPGTPIAVILPPVEGVGEAIRDATALASERASSDDLEFAVRQLVEVAVRALSPGINDPNSATSVLNRLGAMLCALASLHLPTGVHLREARLVLQVPSVAYGGLVDAMFHMIRQNAAGSTAVLIRMLEVLTAVVSCERDTGRVTALQRHADLVMSDAERSIGSPQDLNDVRERHAGFALTRCSGPLGLLGAGGTDGGP